MGNGIESEALLKLNKNFNALRDLVDDVRQRKEKIRLRAIRRPSQTKIRLCSQADLSYVRK